MNRLGPSLHALESLVKNEKKPKPKSSSTIHTAYIWNIMCQKLIENFFAENMQKIMGAIWDLPAT